MFVIYTARYKKCACFSLFCSDLCPAEGFRQHPAASKRFKTAVWTAVDYSDGIEEGGGGNEKEKEGEKRERESKNIYNG